MSGKRLKAAPITSFVAKKPRRLSGENSNTSHEALAASTETQLPEVTAKAPTLPGPTLIERCHDDNVIWCSHNGIPDRASACTAADFIMSDPALRPPNLFRIKHLVDDPALLRHVLQAYANMKPHQPRLTKYPPTDFGGSTRSFQPGWFDKFQWLEYSETTNAVYCKCCYLSRDVMMKEKDLSVFTQVALGYKNWKKAMSKSGFAKHIGDAGSRHQMAESEFRARLDAAADIGLALQQQGATERLQNRSRIGMILDICLFLSCQGMPFRGHDETEESLNRGNFLEMVAFMSERVPSFSHQMNSAAGNAKYTSPQVQKQLVQCAADAVRSHIVEKEIGGDFFSVLVDEASCEAKSEHMAIVVRFVSKLTGQITERLFGSVHVKDTHAATLYSALTSYLAKVGLSFCRCRGQGYDGASNMSGEYNGLQHLVQASCPQAYYIHCFAHRLNLVLVSVAQSTVSVVECFDIVQKNHTTYGASCKRKDHLLDIAADENERLVRDGLLETGRGQNQPQSTESLSTTRWNCHVRALRRVKSLWGPITKVLETVSQHGSNPQKRAEAAGILAKMWTFDFIFHVELMISVLEKSNTLSLYLQKKDMDIVTASHLVEQVTTELYQMLDDSLDEDGFSAIWNRTAQFCTSIQSDGFPAIPNAMDAWTRRGGRSRGRGIPGVPGSDAPRRSAPTSCEEHYRDDVLKVVVHGIIEELEARFSGKMIRLMELCGGLSPRNSFKSWNVSEIVEIAADYYADDFDSQIECLKSEATRFGQLAKRDKRFSGLKTMESLSILMFETDMNTTFAVLYRLVCLVCVLPVTTAGTERAFSAMKRIKTRLRTSMGDAWLSDLLVLSMESDLTKQLDKESMLDSFSTMADRRIAM